jgi:hypothetical protein
MLYKCLCVPTSGVNPFLDTIQLQNLPYNPIKVEGRVLRRGGTGNHYNADYNCNPNGCDSYTLDAYNGLDSVQYKVEIPWNGYICRGRRL